MRYLVTVSYIEIRGKTVSMGELARNCGKK